MNKRQCKELLKFEDKCPDCKKGRMDIAEESLGGDTYCYLICNNCGGTFEGD